SNEQSLEADEGATAASAPPLPATAMVQATEPVEAEPAAPLEEPAVETVPPAEPTPAAEAQEPIIFEIQQEGSQARYVIDEVLRGAPTTVVGSTNQVAGQIAVDPANRTAQVGTILINARTFATDESRRDNAVQNRILLTNQYEYITFAPTAIAGLPDSAGVGESYTFRVTGDLTIRDVTRPVTFDVTVTALSESQLEGSARAAIRYADWGISIPQVPFVASVADEVQLELDFVAGAV
ncbi:MAG TPA: YceI family protein, partial [Ardenticatenaceae bacterium]|nr:YceI family protein [Ardenticatenaceae bacterium]